WMTAQRQQEDRLQAARYARYDYSDNRADDEYPRDYENSEDSYNDDSNEDYSITQTDDETDNNIKAW
ncbi:MAG: hypothetical protein ABS880_07540, partial [Psychrobacter alimentarius]